MQGRQLYSMDKCRLRSTSSCNALSIRMQLDSNGLSAKKLERYSAPGSGTVLCKACAVSSKAAAGPRRSGLPIIPQLNLTRVNTNPHLALSSRAAGSSKPRICKPGADTVPHRVKKRSRSKAVLVWRRRICAWSF